MNLLKAMPGHAEDSRGDRSLGDAWEGKFCEMAGRYNLSYVRLQKRVAGAASWYRGLGGPDGIERQLLPDIWILTAPGEYHEIKHKRPAASGHYGIECYRFGELREFHAETKRPTLYTIHDWELAGAQNSRQEMPNRIAHWRTVDFTVLARNLPDPGTCTTWRDGRKVENVPIYYWPTSLWEPLSNWWARAER